MATTPTHDAGVSDPAKGVGSETANVKEVMAPLRKIIRTRHDGYGTFHELLDCGHVVNSTDLRPAERRRCHKCVLGEPSDIPDWTRGRWG